MEELEEKYKEHKLPEELKEEIQDPYCLIMSMDSLIEEWEKQEKSILRKRRKNHFFQILLGENELLLQEDSYLEKFLDLLEDNMDFLIEILEVITDENYLELARVVDFIVNQYVNNRGYIQGRIEGLSQSMNGFQYIDNRYSYNHEELKVFIRKILASMKKEKQLEKKQDV